MTRLARPDEHADLPAVTDESGKRWSYRELLRHTDGIGHRLGSRRGLLVLRCGNNAESVAAYLAALRGGHVLLLVERELDPDLLQVLVRRYEANWLYEPAGAGTPDYALSALRPPPHASLHPDLALLLSTSGSTGSPKLIRLSEKNLQANAESIAAYLGLTSDERPITTLPMSYSYGLSVINSHLLAGAHILLNEAPVTGRGFWDRFRREGATSLAGVPFIYETLLRLRFERMDLPSLRYFTQAGGKLRTELVERLALAAAERGWRFFVMYGQTEATARMAYLPPDQAAAHPDAIGIAIPGGRLWIAGASGEEIRAPGVEGELLYSGPNVMLGYAEGPGDLARGDELQGTLHTGDLGHRDGDGYFHVTGRLKRFIKVHGKRIGLDDVEEHLRRSGVDCAATGRDELLIIAAAGADPERLRATVCSAYGLHRSAVRAFGLEAIPKNAAGKVQYGSIRELAGEAPPAGG